MAVTTLEGKSGAGAALWGRATAPETLVITRWLDAPRRLVWTLWTDPAHLVRWWGPPGCTNTACSMQVVVGGSFRLHMHAPDGAVYPCLGVFREIVPQERIVLEGQSNETCPGCGAGLPPGSLVTISFADEAAGTRLQIETSFPTEAARQAAIAAGLESGWAGTLERLAELAAQRES